MIVWPPSNVFKVSKETSKPSKVVLIAVKITEELGPTSVKFQHEPQNPESGPVMLDRPPMFGNVGKSAKVGMENVFPEHVASLVLVDPMSNLGSKDSSASSARAAPDARMVTSTGDIIDFMAGLAFL